MALFFVLESAFMTSRTILVNAQSLQCETPEQKIQCQADLAQAEADAKAAQAQLVDAQSQSSSLQQTIRVLDAKIKVAQANIKAKNLLIQTLGNNITEKQSHINTLEEHVARGEQSLATILRKTNEVDSYSLPEVILSQSSVTGFFQDLDTFQSLREGLDTTFNQLRSDKAQTTAEKDALDKRKNTETDARYIIEQSKKSIESDQAQKNQLLKVSKGNEKAYGTLLAQKQAKAAQIRAALFPLAGGGKPIPFGDAYKYALDAQKRTGIRPAFLLAIFAQESTVDGNSTFGKNVGLCNLANQSTGEGIGINTKTTKIRTMNPTRDVPPFLTITKALGFDPFATRVSCWIPVYDKSGSPSGWGGAMGPAQFIPSTWMLLKTRIASTVGITGMPDPWNPSHAFTAASILLDDLGASGKTYTVERTAALKYYAGSNWNSSKNAFYGNQVMVKAVEIQSMIDEL